MLHLPRLGGVQMTAYLRFRSAHFQSSCLYSSGLLCWPPAHSDLAPHSLKQGLGKECTSGGQWLVSTSAGDAGSNLVAGQGA